MSSTNTARKLKTKVAKQQNHNTNIDNDVDNEHKKSRTSEIISPSFDERVNEAIDEDTIHHSINDKNNRNYENNDGNNDRNENNGSNRDNLVVLSKNSLKRLLIHTADSALQLSKKEKLSHTSASIFEDFSFPYNYTPKTLLLYVREISEANVFRSYNTLVVNFSNILSRSKSSKGRKMAGHSTEKVRA